MIEIGLINYAPETLDSFGCYFEINNASDESFGKTFMVQFFSLKFHFRSNLDVSFPTGLFFSSFSKKVREDRSEFSV
jgi:hypothetical protein